MLSRRREAAREDGLAGQVHDRVGPQECLPGHSETVPGELLVGTGLHAVRAPVRVEEGKRFCASTRIFALAESLGGVESLIEHPASMTHASVPAERKRAMGLTAGLARLSVGVEDVEDLVDHLFLLLG